MPNKRQANTADTPGEGIYPKGLVGVRFDDATLAKVMRFAKRKHGSTKGFVQDYIRAAVIGAINADALEEGRQVSAGGVA
jgi:hypothetical protein